MGGLPLRKKVGGTGGKNLHYPSHIQLIRANFYQVPPHSLLRKGIGVLGGGHTNISGAYKYINIFVWGHTKFRGIQIFHDTGRPKKLAHRPLSGPGGQNPKILKKPGVTPN